MSRLLRPAILILAWGALTAGALVFVLGPSWFGVSVNQAVARPVPAGDQEVAWFNAATNAVAWERFVAGIRRLERDPELGLKIVDDSNAFPDQTTAVPEIAVTIHNNRHRLWFRWYKLTGDIAASQWTEALLHRDPPPLAIIGGGSSDRARDLAVELQQRRAQFASAPLLLFTTATADEVDVDGKPRDLMSLYPERSFRYCFTNKQMAEAVTDFIWKENELRPDAEPIYLVRWKDDPYSNDLFDRFREVISSEKYSEPVRQRQALRSATQQWAWLAGFAATGGLPPGLDFDGCRQIESMDPNPFWSVPIPYSEGDYSQPSYWDAAAAEKLMDEYLQHPGQTRPLLVMPANPPSGRRFLRALVRIAPTEAGRFVVATGDAIDFNTVYRDRRLAWPIQDLPITLIGFCHRNPVDPDSFQPEQREHRHDVPDPTGRTSTGTQDLLLYEDIVASVAEAAYRGGTLVSSAEQLASALREGHWKDGRPRFDEHGNQTSGGGEYIVWLEPVRHGDRVKPFSFIQVYTREKDAPRWELISAMTVEYIHIPSALPGGD
jgi:hypothetical protein